LLHWVLHVLMLPQMKPPAHGVDDAAVHVPVPLQLRAGVRPPLLHIAVAHTVLAGYSSHAEPFARHLPSLPHELEPWSVHAVAQQMVPPAAPATHAPLVHCVLPVHVAPFPWRAHLSDWHRPLAQSADAAQLWFVVHVLLCPSHVAPPQSMSVSVPFWAPSVHVAAWHVFVGDPLQILFTQSPPTEHFFVSAHFAHVAPPQSMSVSSESWTLSLQCAATHLPAPSHTVPPLSEHAVPCDAFVLPHTLALHVKLAQTVPVAGQSFGARHATQLPEPLHLRPPFDAHVAPCDAFAVPHAPAVHVATMQSFAGGGQLEGLVQPPSPPASPGASGATSGAASEPLSVPVSAASTVASPPPSSVASAGASTPESSTGIFERSKSTSTSHPPSAARAGTVSRAATRANRRVVIMRLAR
jgi:hypothetical protein